jgi:WD40 repeat protein
MDFIKTIRPAVLFDAKFWDPGTAQPAGAINVGSIFHATLNPHGRTLAVASGNIARKSVTKARFSHDGRWVVASSYDHTARIWDAETGKTTTVLKGHAEIVWSAAFSPDQPPRGDGIAR